MRRTTTTTKTTTTSLDGLLAAADRCLDELRTLPRGRRFDARRAQTQRLYADLGSQIRAAVFGKE